MMNYIKYLITTKNISCKKVSKKLKYFKNFLDFYTHSK